MVGNGAGSGGEAGDGGQELEAAAAMVAATPAISGAGDWPGENQGRKWSAVVAAARPVAAGSGGAPCSRRRPNRAATPGGGAGGTPASDGMGKERLEVSRRHSFVVRPRASVCGRVARAGRHELSANMRKRGVGLARGGTGSGSAWLGLAE
uniref:Uncharacterized protein n=1 Tax=Oryza rufipogon TaxID=4529 RepID=A0A0E0MX09_ORYRU